MSHDLNESTVRKLPTWVRIGMMAVAFVALVGAIVIPAGRAQAAGIASGNSLRDGAYESGIQQDSTSVSATTGASEMLVYDWNKPIIQGNSGFALYNPLSSYPQFNNGNWSIGNFQNGTLHFRAHVRSMPVAAGPAGQPGMKLGFCFWQSKPKYGEECSKNIPVPGVPGTDRRWTQTLGSMNEIGRKPINWTQPRWMAGFVVRNSKGQPVSKKLDFNWSGEDPKKWYPMDIRFTVVLVAPGATFSGWKNYGWTTP